jgi:hypothetical protein
MYTWRSGTKLATIVALCFAAFPFIRSEFWAFERQFTMFFQSDRYFLLLFHSMIWVAIWIAVAASPLIQKTIPRVVVSSIWLVSTPIYIGYCLVTGAHRFPGADIEIGIFDLLWRERAMALSIAPGYWQEIAICVLAVIVLGYIAFLKPESRFSIRGWIGYLPLGVLCVAYSLVFLTKGGLALPSIAVLPARVVLGVIMADRSPPPEPSSIQMTATAAAFEKVVFIMDESIRGDMTSLIDPSAETTPFLLSINNRLTDFGTALSAHNCSTASRFIMRYGLRPEDLPQALRAGLSTASPNIWRYAKKAGFKTVYIDGFARIWALHSGMALRELEDIDEHIKITTEPFYRVDMDVAQALADVLKRPGKAFIYVDKFGSHFPYTDKYPPERRIFAPSRGSERSELIAEYKNAVNWSVDAFFQELDRKGLSLSTTLIIYTSDHGQSLMEGGYKLSHCSIQDSPVRGEGLVPLLAFHGFNDFGKRLQESAVAGRNRFTHFDIFPTLLIGLGFPESEVTQLYGPSLLAPPTRSQQFLIGGSSTLRWTSLDDGPK